MNLSSRETLKGLSLKIRPSFFQICPKPCNFIHEYACLRLDIGIKIYQEYKKKKKVLKEKKYFDGTPQNSKVGTYWDPLRTLFS